MQVEEAVDARTTRFNEEQAWDLLKQGVRVTVAKGKKVQVFDDPSGSKAEVLQNAMGPSGNLRAPTYRVGDEFIIGFNNDLYTDWVK
ncbi:MAG: hypothetical protein C0616_01440 [Desulfuromonas sp.]|nr:MAG: hypothetical protein C0616_01440 [Desulfuromonas sp.]